VLCHQPVRGLYVVCPGCGHGGHLGHLAKWFGQHTTCPSGCGHACSFAQLQLAPSAQLAGGGGVGGGAGSGSSGAEEPQSRAALLSHLAKV
jgi:hypothetical protein